MVRMSLLALAALVVAAAVSSPAEEKQAPIKEGFRVYSVRLRCGNRDLVGTYPTDREALRAVAALRGKHPGGRFEVTTGSEGKLVPVAGMRPVVFSVYMKGCEKAGWRRESTLTDAKEAARAVQDNKKEGVAVEVIHDYAPKLAYHVYGSHGCSRSTTQRGTYLTVTQACEAAERFRADKTYQITWVTSVTREARLAGYGGFGTPTQYQVYRPCKGGWSLETTTTDLKAVEEHLARQKAGSRVEVVRHFAGK